MHAATLAFLLCAVTAHAVDCPSPKQCIPACTPNTTSTLAPPPTGIGGLVVNATDACNPHGAHDVSIRRLNKAGVFRTYGKIARAKLTICGGSPVAYGSCLGVDTPTQVASGWKHPAKWLACHVLAGVTTTTGTTSTTVTTSSTTSTTGGTTSTSTTLLGTDCPDATHVCIPGIDTTRYTQLPGPPFGAGLRVPRKNAGQWEQPLNFTFKSIAGPPSLTEAEGPAVGCFDDRCELSQAVMIVGGAPDPDVDLWFCVAVSGGCCTELMLLPGELD